MRFPLKPVTRLLVASPVIFGLSIAALAACSSGGGTSSAAPPAISSSAAAPPPAAAPCIIEDATSAGTVYIQITGNPPSAVCQSALASAQAGNTDPSSTVTEISSVPSGLTQACSGTISGAVGYTVFDDGTSNGALLGQSACGGITSGGS